MHTGTPVKATDYMSNTRNVTLQQRILNSYFTLLQDKEEICPNKGRGDLMHNLIHKHR